MRQDGLMVGIGKGHLRFEKVLSLHAAAREQVLRIADARRKIADLAFGCLDFVLGPQYRQVFLGNSQLKVVLLPHQFVLLGSRASGCRTNLVADPMTRVKRDADLPAKE
jgi:hypothetical protein